jgi:glycosyltransferase involved in cell wall biosynthesis
MDNLHICLINDSFPPVIDGVSNAVANYARILSDRHGGAAVLTPYYPDADDSRYPFPVYRYPSLDLTRQLGYRAGIPFSPEIMGKVENAGFDLLHSHCPVTSTLLARALRDRLDLPLVLTYHTKFDIDIANAVRSKHLQAEAIKILVRNIDACDEVWTVSRGAGENLRSLGFEKRWSVMPNGVDFPRGRVSEEAVRQETGQYDLPAGLPVFLFVGRMMWYKGIRIILDALKLLDAEGRDFRMVFVGGGGDKEEIVAYAESLGLPGKLLFVEPIRDRERIRAWYCRADLFLFPSTFDTNGLVVREAAACALPSLLVRGSCAAEDSTDGEDGFLIEENADSMAACLRRLLDAPERIRAAGERAQKNLYLSWEDAVANACEGYRTVIDNYRAGRYPAHKGVSDEVLHRLARLMDWAERLDPQRQPPDPAERSLPFGELASVLRKVREARDGGQRPDRFL